LLFSCILFESSDHKSSIEKLEVCGVIFALSVVIIALLLLASTVTFPSQELFHGVKKGSTNGFAAPVSIFLSSIIGSLFIVSWGIVDVHIAMRSWVSLLSLPSIGCDELLCVTRLDDV